MVVIRRLLVFILSFAAITAGLWGTSSISAGVKGSPLLPIYFYWDAETPQMDAADMAEKWNHDWNWPGHLNGQKLRDCSDLEKALAGKPYSYEVAREIRNSDYCPMVTMVGRIGRPRRAFFSANKLDKEIYRHLDMSSLHWGDLDKRLGQNGPYTLAQLSRKGIALNKNQIAFDLGDRSYQMNIIMLADFEGNGGQQIYCELRYYDGKTKTAVEYPVLLTREKKGGPIFVRPVYVKKPASFKLPAKLLANMESLDPRYDEP